MNNNVVYSSMFEDDEPQYRLRDRISNKRLEKRERQIQARKTTKQGTRKNVNEIRKDADARDVRSSRPREVSILPETSNDEGF